VQLIARLRKATTPDSLSFFLPASMPSDGQLQVRSSLGEPSILAHDLREVMSCNLALYPLGACSWMLDVTVASFDSWRHLHECDLMMVLSYCCQGVVLQVIDWAQNANPNMCMGA
jgi:hypothetical protein